MPLNVAEALRCPACAHGFAVAAARSIGPEARPAVLAGTFHRFTCPACRTPMLHTRPVLYLDSGRGQVVQVQPVERKENFLKLEQQLEAAFRAVTAEAPAAWRGPASRFRVRLVFGTAALREKLVGWDAGLDDALVALLKHDLRLRRPSLGPLQLEQVTPAGILLTSTGGHRVRLPHLRYERFAAERAWLAGQWPDLFRGPWVDAERLPTPVA